MIERGQQPANLGIAREPRVECGTDRTAQDLILLKWLGLCHPPISLSNVRLSQAGEELPQAGEELRLTQLCVQGSVGWTVRETVLWGGSPDRIPLMKIYHNSPDADLPQ